MIEHPLGTIATGVMNPENAKGGVPRAKSGQSSHPAVNCDTSMYLNPPSASHSDFP
jgi:hypothetical protein